MAGYSAAFPDVRVRFTVETASGNFLDEPDPAQFAPEAARLPRLFGQVRIRSGRDPLVAPEDELLPLVKNLCYRAVAELADRDHVVVNYTDSYGLLRLDREGDTMRISGDGVPDVRVGADRLLHGLVECGERFTEWLAAIDGVDTAAVVDLQAEGVLARAALADFGD